MPLNIFAIGGSRNVGYLAALRFLAEGATVTFLSRSTHIFANDSQLQEYIKAGKAIVVKGDGLVEDDVRRGWEESMKHGHVDALVFTVGTTTQSFHLLKGIMISPHNLCTQVLLNTLCTMPKSMPQPKIVVVTSTGITAKSHVPFLIAPVWSYLLKGPQGPHRDKLGAERIMAHCAGWEWDTKGDGEPGEALMGPGNWQERKGLPEAGSLCENAMILRPVAFTHGECQGDLKKGTGEKPYNASDGEVYGYSISRKDVAHFIVEAVTNNWSEYGGKRISLSY